MVLSTKGILSQVEVRGEQGTGLSWNPSHSRTQGTCPPSRGPRTWETDPRGRGLWTLEGPAPPQQRSWDTGVPAPLKKRPQDTGETCPSKAEASTEAPWQESGLLLTSGLCGGQGLGSGASCAALGPQGSGLPACIMMFSRMKCRWQYTGCPPTEGDSECRAPRVW